MCKPSIKSDGKGIDNFLCLLTFFMIHIKIVIEEKRMLMCMLPIIIKIIAILMILAGVILIYDARSITKRFFGFGDQNEGSSGLKIVGFIVAIGGAIILFFVK